MPHPTVPVVVRHPVTGQFVALNPAINYADDDLLVESYSWAFVEQEKAPEPVESVTVEQATAAPGEKRSRIFGKPSA